MRQTLQNLLISKHNIKIVLFIVRRHCVSGSYMCGHAPYVSREGAITCAGGEGGREDAYLFSEHRKVKDFRYTAPNVTPRLTILTVGSAIARIINTIIRHSY